MNIARGRWTIFHYSQVECLASVSEVADSTAARSQSLNPPYLKRRTVAESVANVGESVAYLGVNTRP